MEETRKKLELIESKWLELFFRRLKTYFSDVHLPSHDHLHHLRVWQFVKSILAHLEQKDIVYNSHELLNLMLASLFHDVGLIHTLDEWHGRAGADICRNFIESLNIPVRDFLPALEAIEKHDDKLYDHTRTLEGKPSILLILSTADDLDAFGFIGIVRYAEIYLLRKTSIEDIADKVIINSGQRFRHFRSKFRHFEDLVEQQKQRYEPLVNFYRSVSASPASKKKKKNILQHIRNNVENHQNNNNLTDLLNPIDREYIEDFKNKMIEEQQQFSDHRKDQFN